MSDELIIIFIVIIGLVLGSFYCCMGYRIPNKMKTVFDRSICPKCKKELKWYMNIPVLSFIVLKGRCAYCKKPIDFIYPFTEILTALLFLCNYALFDFGYEFYISCILSSMLVVTIVSDFIYYYISDRVLILGGLSSIIIMYLYSGFDYTFSHLIAGIIIFVVMIIIKLFGNLLFKKESLGDGDIKLMGIIALILGLTKGFVCLFIGALIGLVFSLFTYKKNKEGIIPFGPFLLIGALITMYFSTFIEIFINNYLLI